jgi:ribosomal-protein-alanine N-acetyltransferase
MTDLAADVVLAPMRWWHIEALLAIDRALFGAEMWSDRMLWNELAQHESRHYLVAMEGDEPIGYAGLASYEDESCVQTIGVRPDHQGRGIGTALLRALLDEAERRGTPAVLLEVRADNLDAQRLYERHGFRAIGLRRGYYQPSRTDAVVMRRG